MSFDLHTHTQYSDGSLSPLALINAAKQSGITHLAITDHDNDFAISALREKDDSAGEFSLEGIQLLTGIEFSTRWESTDIHVLALNFTLGATGIKNLIQSQTTARRKRNDRILEKLARCGVELSQKSTLASVPQIGRVHIADMLVQDGYAKNRQQAFKRYLGRSGKAYVRSDWASLTETIATINEAGGSAVLAHPLKYQLSGAKLRRMVDDYAALGGGAIEVISGKQAISDTTALADLSLHFGLSASLGSDFHSPNQPWCSLGCTGELPARCEPVWARWDSYK